LIEIHLVIDAHRRERAMLASDASCEETPVTNEAMEKARIREMVENWALWRDQGDWQRFRSLWHDDGWMMATWFQGPADRFIAVSREGFERGVNILHFLGGSTIDLVGNRAIAQTKMQIHQRAPVDGVLCDVICSGRFYDFLEARWSVGLGSPPANL